MALVNYMGDAPGFMSYQRQRSRAPLQMVEPYQASQQAPPLKDLGDDFDGNPGDKQWLYDRNEAFNQGLTSLYNEYGGEMDWVITDPRYKQLVAADRNFVKNQEAAIQNKQNTTKRKDDLKNMNSGQADADFELVYERGAWIPKKVAPDANGEARIYTKGDYLQDAIWQPQEVQHEDGSIGIGHTQFDYGTGNEDNWNRLMTGFFSGLGEDSWASKSTVGTDFDAEALGYGMTSLKTSGRSASDNYDQVNDAVNYLIEYGFDTNHEYFIAQEMYRDQQSGKSFKKPKTDEEGNILRKKNGDVILENYYMTDEDLQSPERIKYLTQFYIQDRVEKFAKKYRAKSTESETVDKSGFYNVDPTTGAILEDPSLRRWEAIVGDQGPKGEGFTETFTEYAWNEHGKMVGRETTGEVYNDANLPQGMEQAREAIVGKSLKKLTPDGKVKIGGMWTTIDQKYLDELTPTDLQDVRRVKGKPGEDDQWVARTFVIVDEDADVLEKLKFYDATAKTVKGGVSYSTLGVSSLEDAAVNQGIVRNVSADEIKNKDWKVSAMSDVGWDLSTESDDVGIWIDVPVNNQMVTWDQQAVGESRKKEGEQKEVVPRAQQVNQERQQNQGQRQFGREFGVFD